MAEVEDTIVQISVDGQWHDYCRTTRENGRDATRLGVNTLNGHREARAVDWITREVV